MPTWLKVILVIVAAIVALVFAAGYVGYRWLASHKGEFEAQAAAVRADATAFSQGKDANACVEETLTRADRCDGIICEAKTKLFLSVCLEKTGVPPEVCASIPKRTDFMASAKWVLAECARRGRPNDQRCTRMIVALQERCGGGNRYSSSKTSASAISRSGKSGLPITAPSVSVLTSITRSQRPASFRR